MWSYRLNYPKSTEFVKVFKMNFKFTGYKLHTVMHALKPGLHLNFDNLY